jgi:hypothetical protein
MLLPSVRARIVDPLTAEKNDRVSPSTQVSPCDLLLSACAVDGHVTRLPCVPAGATHARVRPARVGSGAAHDEFARRLRALGVIPLWELRCEFRGAARVTLRSGVACARDKGDVKRAPARGDLPDQNITTS